MASPSSPTRAAISSSEIRIRPGWCSMENRWLLRRRHVGRNRACANTIGHADGLVPRLERPHPDPIAGLSIRGGHGRHLRIEALRGELLLDAGRLLSAAEHTDLNRPL